MGVPQMQHGWRRGWQDGGWQNAWQHRWAGIRRFRNVAIVAVGLAVGLAIPAVGERIGDDTSRIPAPQARTVSLAASNESEPVTTDGPPGQPAPTPRQAVEKFLSAEAAEQFDQSYRFLAHSNRVEYGSDGDWTAAHADFFPVERSTTRQVAKEGDTTVVTTEVRFRSSLDEVLGLVPARAKVRWPVVSEDGGWLVDFDAAVIEPLFPPETDVRGTAQRWLRDRQACQPANEYEYEGGLVGSGTVNAEQLCGAPTAELAESLHSLDPIEGAVFVSAFGDASWARAVDVRGEVPLTLVLAPVDDRWLVIGALPAR